MLVSPSMRKTARRGERRTGEGRGAKDRGQGTGARQEAEETARQEIRDYLAKIPPYDLQELVAALLRAMG